METVTETVETTPTGGDAPIVISKSHLDTLIAAALFVHACVRSRADGGHLGSWEIDRLVFDLGLVVLRDDVDPSIFEGNGGTGPRLFANTFEYSDVMTEILSSISEPEPPKSPAEEQATQ